MEVKLKRQKLFVLLNVVAGLSGERFHDASISTGHAPGILAKFQIGILTLLLSIYIPASSWAVDGQRKLTQPVPPATFPIIINQSGSYVLTSNLVVTDPNQNAIEITVNDVTLDLNGHSIQGPNTGAGDGYGIYAPERYSIILRNGRIWGFGMCGVFLSTSDFAQPVVRGAGHIVDNIQAMYNAEGGIAVVAGIIKNCTANNNGNPGYYYTGIRAFESTISDCIANNNSGDGIHADNATVNQCTVNHNHSGIRSNASIIRNCIANNNDNHGIRDEGNSYIIENNLRDNGQTGLILSISDAHSFAIKNVASGNGIMNFFANPGNYMPLTGDNANYGF